VVVRGILGAMMTWAERFDGVVGAGVMLVMGTRGGVDGDDGQAGRGWSASCRGGGVTCGPEQARKRMRSRAVLEVLVGVAPKGPLGTAQLFGPGFGVLGYRRIAYKV